MPDMPFGFVRCERAPFGWYCRRQAEHVGMCDAKARWWNLAAYLRNWQQGL